MNQQHNILQKPIVVAFLACICCLLWGSAFPSIKVGYRLFQIAAGDSASQILFAGCRFTLAGILTVIIGSVLRRKVLLPHKSSFLMIGKLSLVQTVIQYVFFYVGMAHTTGMKGSIINGSSTFIAILLASLVFHYEKLDAKKLIGCIIGFAGVIVINLDPTGMGEGIRLTGEGFILVSATSYAFSSILIKKYSQNEDPVVLSGYQFFIGGLVMIVIGLVLGGSLHPTTSMAFVLIFYMACISAVAYSIWGILLKYNPVGNVTMYGLTNPIFGALLSAVILKEAGQMSMVQTLAALVLVSTGIFIVNKEPNNKGD